MSLISLIKPNGPSGFGYGSTAEDVTADRDLRGKNILVTGTNSGLGAETLRVLTLRGAHVFATARDEAKAKTACEGAQGQGQATPLVLDLESPPTVRACVDTLHRDNTRLDVIICNAGIMALPKREQAFGLERQFFTNHIGHFMLVTGLLDLLADDGRVVILSSGAHVGAPKCGIDFDDLAAERKYTSWRAYGQSKLANLLFAKELGRRFSGSGSAKTAYAVHPGVIQTNLGRHMSGVMSFGLSLAGPLFLKSIPQGAATQCYCATHPDAVAHSGSYFADSNVAKPRADAEDPELASKLWERSEEIVAGLP